MAPFPNAFIAMSETLKVLDLRRNNLTDKISYIFPSNCGLQTLNLKKKKKKKLLLEGVVPKSFANCTILELLDIRNKQIQYAFQC